MWRMDFRLQQHILLMTNKSGIFLGERGEPASAFDMNTYSNLNKH